MNNYPQHTKIFLNESSIYKFPVVRADDGNRGFFILNKNQTDIRDIKRLIRSLLLVIQNRVVANTQQGTFAANECRSIKTKLTKLGKELKFFFFRDVSLILFVIA